LIKEKEGRIAKYIYVSAIFGEVTLSIVNFDLNWKCTIAR